MDIGRQMDSRGAIEKFKQSFLRFWVLYQSEYHFFLSVPGLNLTPCPLSLKERGIGC